MLTEKPTIADLARDYAKQAHDGQFRKDGQPYFTHPERVEQLVRHYKASSKNIETLCAAALLHDVLEDFEFTNVTYYDLFETFRSEIAALVLELTTNPEMKRGVGDKGEYLSYKLLHMTSWALVIKLCDRLDNITDMSVCSEEWKRRYADETWYIIEYLKKNRKLSPAHGAIIEEIKRKLNSVY